MAETTEKKVKKRKWYEIVSKDFNNEILGETLTKDPNSVMNKVLKVSLNNLMREGKFQNATIIFKVVSLNDNKFDTDIYGYVLNPSYIKRIVKNKKTKIDDSNVYTLKDNLKIRIKPVIITRNTINRSLRKNIFKKTRQMFIEYFTKKSYLEFFKDLIDKKLIIEFKKELSKVYPLSVFEIRIMKRLG